MSTRERYLLAATVVVSPWALVVLPLAAEDPHSAILAISPAALIAIALNQEGLGVNLSIVLSGTLLLIGVVAWVAQRAQGALLPIGLTFFAVACWLAAQMRQ